MDVKQEPSQRERKKIARTADYFYACDDNNGAVVEIASSDRDGDGNRDRIPACDESAGSGSAADEAKDEPCDSVAHEQPGDAHKLATRTKAAYTTLTVASFVHIGAHDEIAEGTAAQLTPVDHWGLPLLTMQLACLAGIRRKWAAEDGASKHYIIWSEDDDDEYQHFRLDPAGANKVYEYFMSRFVDSGHLQEKIRQNERNICLPVEWKKVHGTLRKTLSINFLVGLSRGTCTNY